MLRGVCDGEVLLTEDMKIKEGWEGQPGGFLFLAGAFDKTLWESLYKAWKLW